MQMKAFSLVRYFSLYEEFKCLFYLITNIIQKWKREGRHLPEPKALATSHVRLHDILALVKS